MAVDIFELLKHIDLSDREYFKNLDPKDQKEIYFFLIQRWMSGSNNSKQIIYINNFINNKVWKLHAYPELLYYLLCASSINGKKYYKWPQRPKKEMKSETIKVVMEYYRCSKNDAKEYLEILSIDNIEDICNIMGIDKETISKIKKENK